MLCKLAACILLIFININGYCQSEINYSPKPLFKELSKYSKLESIELKEIPRSDAKYYNGKFFKIINTLNNYPLSYIYIGRVNSSRGSGSSIDNKYSDYDQNEYFDYFIFFDKSLSVVLVKVYNYQASHGQEVTSTGWLRQFIGYNGAKSLNVGKEVDAISGATISVNGITTDIKHKTEILKKSSF